MKRKSERILMFGILVYIIVLAPGGVRPKSARTWSPACMHGRARRLGQSASHSRRPQRRVHCSTHEPRPSYLRLEYVNLVVYKAVYELWAITRASYTYEPGKLEYEPNFPYKEGQSSYTSEARKRPSRLRASCTTRSEYTSRLRGSCVEQCAVSKL